MKRTKLSKLVESHGSLRDQITDPDADYAVYDVMLRNSNGCNAVLFDIPAEVSTELVEIVRPINLRILTLSGIGRVLIHTRMSGKFRQQRLAVAEKPVDFSQGDIYAYQSGSGLVLLDTSKPPFQNGDEIEPGLTTLPAALVAAHRGGYSAALTL